MYVGIHYFMELYGVSASTIRRWCDSGKLVVHHRTFGGHRRFAVDAPAAETDERAIVGYARVSSYDQKSDLERQVERLKRSGCDEVLTDIGSGLNCRKPGLNTLLGRLLSGRVGVLRVAHEDRLLRFGTELIRRICRHERTSFEVMEERPAMSFEAELAKDVITLMTVFCARLYGRRSHQNKEVAGDAAGPPTGPPHPPHKSAIVSAP